MRIRVIKMMRIKADPDQSTTLMETTVVSQIHIFKIRNMIQIRVRICIEVKSRIRIKNSTDPGSARYARYAEKREHKKHTVHYTMCNQN